MHASIEGITWDRLERESSVTYPAFTPDDPGQPIVFTDQIPHPTGRLQLVPASVIPAAAQPTPSSRSCSSPAASWSIGTPAA